MDLLKPASINFAIEHCSSLVDWFMHKSIKALNSEVRSDVS